MAAIVSPRPRRLPPIHIPEDIADDKADDTSLPLPVRDGSLLFEQLGEPAKIPGCDADDNVKSPLASWQEIRSPRLAVSPRSARTKRTTSDSSRRTSSKKRNKTDKNEMNKPHHRSKSSDITLTLTPKENAGISRSLSQDSGYHKEPELQKWHSTSSLSSTVSSTSSKDESESDWIKSLPWPKNYGFLGDQGQRSSSLENQTLCGDEEQNIGSRLKTVSKQERKLLDPSSFTTDNIGKISDPRSPKTDPKSPRDKRNHRREESILKWSNSMKADEIYEEADENSRKMKSQPVLTPWDFYTMYDFDLDDWDETSVQETVIMQNLEKLSERSKGQMKVKGQTQQQPEIDAERHLSMTHQEAIQTPANPPSIPYTLTPHTKGAAKLGAMKPLPEHYKPQYCISGQPQTVNLDFAAVYQKLEDYLDTVPGRRKLVDKMGNICEKKKYERVREDRMEEGEEQRGERDKTETGSNYETDNKGSIDEVEKTQTNKRGNTQDKLKTDLADSEKKFISSLTLEFKSQETNEVQSPTRRMRHISSEENVMKSGLSTTNERISSSKRVLTDGQTIVGISQNFKIETKVREGNTDENANEVDKRQQDSSANVQELNENVSELDKGRNDHDRELEPLETGHLGSLDSLLCAKNLINADNISDFEPSTPNHSLDFESLLQKPSQKFEPTCPSPAVHYLGFSSFMEPAQKPLMQDATRGPGTQDAGVQTSPLLWTDIAPIAGYGSTSDASTPVRQLLDETEVSGFSRPVVNSPFEIINEREIMDSSTRPVETSPVEVISPRCLFPPDAVKTNDSSCENIRTHHGKFDNASFEIIGGDICSLMSSNSQSCDQQPKMQIDQKKAQDPNDELVVRINCGDKERFEGKQYTASSSWAILSDERPTEKSEFDIISLPKDANQDELVVVEVNELPIKPYRETAELIETKVQIQERALITETEKHPETGLSTQTEKLSQETEDKTPVSAKTIITEKQNQETVLCMEIEESSQETALLKEYNGQKEGLSLKEIENQSLETEKPKQSTVERLATNEQYREAILPKQLTKLNPETAVSTEMNKPNKEIALQDHLTQFEQCQKAEGQSQKTEGYVATNTFKDAVDVQDSAVIYNSCAKSSDVDNNLDTEVLENKDCYALQDNGYKAEKITVLERDVCKVGMITVVDNDGFTPGSESEQITVLDNDGSKHGQIMVLQNNRSKIGEITVLENDGSKHGQIMIPEITGCPDGPIVALNLPKAEKVTITVHDGSQVQEYVYDLTQMKERGTEEQDEKEERDLDRVEEEEIQDGKNKEVNLPNDSELHEGIDGVVKQMKEENEEKTDEGRKRVVGMSEEEMQEPLNHNEASCGVSEPNKSIHETVNEEEGKVMEQDEEVQTEGLNEQKTEDFGIHDDQNQDEAPDETQRPNNRDEVEIQHEEDHDEEEDKQVRTLDKEEPNQIEEGEYQEEGEERGYENHTELLIESSPEAQCCKTPEQMLEDVEDASFTEDDDVIVITVEDHDVQSENESKEESAVQSENKEDSVIQSENEEDSVIQSENKEKSAAQSVNEENTVIQSENKEDSAVQSDNEEDLAVQSENKEESAVQGENKEESIVQSENKEHSAVQSENTDFRVQNEKKEDSVVGSEKKVAPEVPGDKNEDADVRSEQDDSVCNIEKEEDFPIENEENEHPVVQNERNEVVKSEKE